MKEIRNPESIIKEQISDIFHNVGYSTKKIILFGSRVWKDFSSSSDYDLLIITETTFEIKEKMSLSKRIREYLAKSGFDVDVLIKSENEVQVLKEKPGSIVRNAMKEGVALWLMIISENGWSKADNDYKIAEHELAQDVNEMVTDAICFHWWKNWSL